MTIEIVHDGFAFIAVVVPWALGAIFPGRSRPAVSAGAGVCAAEAERAELQAIGSLLESDNSKTGLISLKVLNCKIQLRRTSGAGPPDDTACVSFGGILR